MDDSAQILMLLDRDTLRVHKVRRQINGPHNAPFVIKTDLGWLIIGDVCLGNSHKPSVLSCKTHMLDNGRTSYFSPCQSHINLKDSLCLTAEAQGIPHIYCTRVHVQAEKISLAVRCSSAQGMTTNLLCLLRIISSWRSWTMSFFEIVTIAGWVLSPSDTLDLFFPITENMLLLVSTLFVGIC